MSELIQLEIRQPNKPPSRFTIKQGVYTVGSDDDCKIHLAHKDVEGRHAILTVRNDECRLEDLDAESGTYLDGKRIYGHANVKSRQEIGIGPFVLIIQTDSNPEAGGQKAEAQARQSQAGQSRDGSVSPTNPSRAKAGQKRKPGEARQGEVGTGARSQESVDSG